MSDAIFCYYAPIFMQLEGLYSSVDDRLSLIHACLNAKRLKKGRPNLDMPYFGNSNLRDCWKTAHDTCADEVDWCLPHSCYRFLVLVEKAQELAGEVRALGGALLAAYEKGDAEYLSTMRVMHERQLLNLALDLRQFQWREADWQVQALQKTKEIAQTRLHYYKTLITNGLISGEVQYEPLTISSSTVRTAGNVAVAIGQFMNLIPDPFVGFPANFVKLPPGQKLSNIFGATGTIANTVAEIISTAASLGLTKSGWDRRENDVAQKYLPGAGVRFFDLRQELPEAWHLFSEEGGSPKQVRLKLSQNMFLFLPGHRNVSINRIGLLVEASGATPSAHRVIKFVVNDGNKYLKGEWDDCEMQDIYCIASADWPCLYHGVLGVKLGPLCADEVRDLGTFIFSCDTGTVLRAFLFCGYSATPPRECKLREGTENRMGTCAPC